MLYKTFEAPKSLCIFVHKQYMAQLLSQIRKQTLTILLSLFLAPFVLILIGDIIGSNIPLYTFGLSLKDFFTMWTAIFGVFGIVYNIYQNQRRISQQEKQLDGQSKQIEYQNMQLELQAKSERNSRFAKGVELLGSNQESARTGGVYNLIFLAKEYPNEFKETVFNIHMFSYKINYKYQ